MQGREFSQQEIDYGANVCLISEKLAAINDLSVGDSIPLQTYQNDPGVPYQTDISSGNGASLPMACYYFGTTMSLNSAVEYTIVGIYQQDNAWGNYSDNFYVAHNEGYTVIIVTHDPAVAEQADMVCK